MQTIGDSVTTESIQHDQMAPSPAAFTSHCSQLAIGEQKITLRVLKMNGSTLLFINNTEPEFVDEMGVAMPTSVESNEVLATTIVGPQIISDSQHLAEKLSKRFKRQFFVSYNLQVDRLSGPLLEKHLNEYVRSNESQFV